MNANSENNESNNSGKNDNLDIKRKFLKDFFGNKTNKELIEFADTLYKGKGKINSEIKQELEQYSRAGEIYKGLNIHNIKFSELSERVQNIYMKAVNARNNLEAFIFNNYQINGDIYKNRILPEIKILDIPTIKEINTSRVTLDKFLSKIFKDNLSEKPSPKFAWEFLKELNLENRIYQVPPNRRKDILYIIDKSISTPNALTESDISTLFGLLNLNDQERAEVVKKYFPSITLEGAVKLGIKTRSEAKAIKETFIRSMLDEVNSSEDTENEVNKLLGSIDDKDIAISTDNISPEGTKKILTSSIEFKNVFTQETIRRGNYLKIEYKETLSRNLSEFQKELGQLGVISSEKFKEGGLVEVQLGDKKDPDEITTYYFEISDDGTNSGLIKIIDRGTGKYNSGQITLENEGISYKNFIENFKTGFFADKKVLSMQAYNPDEFKTKLKSGEIQEERDGPRFKEKGYYSKRIKEREEELKNEGFSEEEIEKNEEIQTLKSRNEDIENIEELKIWLDNIDSEGSKFGLEKGVTFSDKKNGFWEIIGFADGEIGIKNIFNENESAYISYSNFFTGFKEGKLTRTSKSKTSEELINTFTSSDGWSGFKIKDGKILKEEEISDGHGHTTTRKIICEYLAPNDPKNDDEVIKILKVESGKIQIQFGTTKINKTEVKGETQKKTSFEIEKSKVWVTPGFLESWIHLHKLQPKDNESQEVKDINTPHDHRQWSFLNWWSQGFSVHNILQGFHDIEHSIQHYFEGGQKEQAAKFAMKIFSVLPYKKIDILGEIRSSMQGDVEMEQKKRMDSQIEHLKGVDSKEATEEIAHWLHYNNTPDYKIHAGMMYMIQGYGVLYAKPALVGLQGTFSWYKALGGKPNDAFFKKIQKECKDAENGQGQPFTEEHLVYYWLKELHRQGRIRSRLHKEFKSARAQSKEADYKKGFDDGNDQRGLRGRVDGGMGELMGGTYPNAVGFMESSLNKGGDIYEMNKLPFIMGFSGISYDFDQIWTLDKIKNLPAKGLIVPILRFLSYNSQMDLLGETILEVSKRISSIEGDPKIYSLALDIYNDRKSNDPKPFKLGKNTFTGYQAKIKRTEAFYKEYGKYITDALYCLHNDNPDEKRSKYAKLITTEKDAGPDFEGNIRDKGNSLFKRYHDTLVGFSSEFSFEKPDILNDSFKYTGITGVDSYEMMTKVLSLSQGGGFHKGKPAEDGWAAIKREMQTINDTKYNSDPRIDYEIKHKYVKSYLRGIIAGYFQNHGSQNWASSALKKTSSPLGYINNWLDIDEVIDAKVDVDDMKNAKNQKFETLINKFAANVIKFEGSKGGDNSNKNLGFSSLIQRTKENTQRATNDNIYTKENNQAA